MYKILSREHLLGRTIEEDERIQKANIATEFASYSLKDYMKPV